MGLIFAMKWQLAAGGLSGFLHLLLVA